MRRISPKNFAILAGLSALIQIGFASTRLPDEPGASPGVTLVDISGNGPDLSSAFPAIAVNSASDQEIGIAWRVYSLPIDTNAPKGSRTAECHVSLSTDGGKRFRDTNLMSSLRSERVDLAHPELWYCNAPWVTFGLGQTVYAGGALFTANGVMGSEPKQGRAMVTTSPDGGATWRKAIPGITIDRLSPGLTGLSGGHEAQDTPWDGASGMADPKTGDLYVTAGAYVAASDDNGKTFGTVFSPNAPGWVRQGGASFAVSFGVLAVAGFMRSTPVADAKCPCLAFGESSDKGAHWTFHLVTGATDVSPTGRPHYPPIAADPWHPGHFAIATTTADRERLQVFFTADHGESWSSASPNSPPKGTIHVTAVDMPGVGFTSAGEPVAAWRGFRAAGAYDVYAATISDAKFGPTLKLDQEASAYPSLVQVGNYSLGGGDFSTPVAGNRTDVFVAFPYSPGGLVQKTTLARIAISQMK